MKKLIPFLLLCALISACNLIELEEIEIKSFDKLTENSAQNERSGILQTESLNYLYCGSNTDGDILFLRIDADGNTVASAANYGSGNGNELLVSNADTTQNNYSILASNETESFLINIDTLGIEINRLAINPIFDSQFGLIQAVNAVAGTTYDEGFIIVGDFQQSLGGSKMFALNLDLAGNTKWLRSYETGAIATGCVRSTRGSIFISGYFNEQLTLFKADESGNLEWRKTLTENTELNHSTNLVFDDADNIILVGGIEDSGQQKLFLAKVDQDKEVLWTKTSGGFEGNLSGSHIERLSNGNFLVTGLKNNGESIPAQQFLQEVDNDGNTVWMSLTNDGINTRYAHNCIETNRRGCLAVGIGRPPGSSPLRLQLFKTDSEGKLE